jgi:signal transduction histidine kinase
VEYDVRPVDLRDVVGDVVPLVDPQMRAKGLAFEVRSSAKPCVVWADREKLAQVLVNLLSNAVKFTDSPNPVTGAPGRVTVSIAAREDGVSPRLDQAFVRVADTGVGIPRDEQERVFEPFVQVRAEGATAYARAAEGTGLGLAISRDLARGMGGDLRVRSTPGKGSTFTVALRRVVDARGQETDRPNGATGRPATGPEQPRLKGEGRS